MFIFLKQDEVFKRTEKLLLKHAVIKMAFIKVESEDVKIEEHEDTETQTEMMFIIEESENMKIEETFRVKHEDIETQTGRFHLSSVILCHESLLFVSLFLLSHFFFYRVIMGPWWWKKILEVRKNFITIACRGRQRPGVVILHSRSQPHV